jgi:Family of unknown function (DUF6286)
VILLKLFVRFLGFLLLVGLAAAGAALALFSIEGGDTGLSVPALAELVSLPELGDTTDQFRDELEASGPTAVLSAAGGLGAIAVGLLLIIGAVTPARERLFTLDDSEEGTLAARRRPLAQFASVLAGRADGVTRARVRARPGRRRGGRIRVTADRAPDTERRDVSGSVERAVEPVAGAFGLKTSISTRARRDEGRRS